MIPGVEGIFGWIPPSGQLVKRTNYAVNPRLADDANGWLLTKSAEVSDLGSGRAEMPDAPGKFGFRAYGKKDAAAGSRSLGVITSSTGAPAFYTPVVPGEVWTLSAEFYTADDSAGAVSSSSNGLRITGFFYKASLGGSIGSSSGDVISDVVGTRQRISKVVEVPAEAAYMRVEPRYVFNQANDVIDGYITNLLIEKGARLGPFFPTAEQIAAGKAEWAGAANGSISNLLGPAVELGQRVDEFGDELWPRFKLQRIGGLHSIGDPEDNRDPRVGGLGEIARPSQRRGKTGTFEGVLEARTLLELREGRDLLAAAFSDLSREGRMDCSWHPDNAEFAGQPPVFFEARPLLVEVFEEQRTKGYNRPFVVGLRQGDPRHFDEESEAHSLTVVNVNTGYSFS
jgi:hypothetical protein